jgi:hypothetical protein
MLLFERHFNERTYEVGPVFMTVSLFAVTFSSGKNPIVHAYPASCPSCLLRAIRGAASSVLTAALLSGDTPEEICF